MRDRIKASWASLGACLALFVAGCPTTYVVLGSDAGVVQPGAGGAGGAGAVGGAYDGDVGGYAGVTGGSAGYVGVGGVGGCPIDTGCCCRDERGQCGGMTADPSGGCAGSYAWDPACGVPGGAGGCGCAGTGAAGCAGGDPACGLTGGVGGCGAGDPACGAGAGGVGGCAADDPVCGAGAGGVGGGPAPTGGTGGGCGVVGEQWSQGAGGSSGFEICTILQSDPCFVDCRHICEIDPGDPSCGDSGVMAGAGGVGGGPADAGAP